MRGRRCHSEARPLHTLNLARVAAGPRNLSSDAMRAVAAAQRDPAATPPPDREMRGRRCHSEARPLHTLNLARVAAGPRNLSSDAVRAVAAAPRDSAATPPPDKATCSRSGPDDRNRPARFRILPTPRSADPEASSRAVAAAIPVRATASRFEQADGRFLGPATLRAFRWCSVGGPRNDRSCFRSLSNPEGHPGPDFLRERTTCSQRPHNRLRATEGPTIGPQGARFTTWSRPLSYAGEILRPAPISHHTNRMRSGASLRKSNRGCKWQPVRP
jgi:hypothetical protein